MVVRRIDPYRPQGGSRFTNGPGGRLGLAGRVPALSVGLGFRFLACVGMTGGASKVWGRQGGSLAALERGLWPLRATRWIPASAGMTVWRWGTDVGIVDGWQLRGLVALRDQDSRLHGNDGGRGNGGGARGSDWGHPHPDPPPSRGREMTGGDTPLTLALSLRERGFWDGFRLSPE